MTTWQNRITRYSEEAPDQLLANPANWRTHPGSQADALRGVMAQVGIVQNVIANERTGYLIDGHLRVMEALKAGQPSIPVTWVDLSPEEEALILATLDPLAAMAGTDPAALDALLREVSTDSPALAAMLDDLAQEAGIVPGVEAGQPDEPVRVDETQPTRCQPGDVWRVGPHIVACLDSTDADAVRRLVAGRKVGMVIADAPYGMNLNTDYAARPLSDKARAKHPTQNSHTPVMGDDKPFDPTPYFELFKGVQEQFWWGADYYRRHLPEGGSWLVWDKRASVEDVEYSSASFELCWSRTPHRRDILRVPWFGIIGMEQEGGRRVHPTQKPISLYARLLGYGAPGDLIIDPFLGSGPSIKAATQMGDGRAVIGFELSPHYCDHIIAWAEAEGLTVERAEP